VSCASCQARLTAYLDGELDDRDASALRGHLRTCAACSEAAAAEAQVIDGLRQLPSMDPPPAMWQAIRSQLAHEEIADAEAPLRVRLWRAWSRKLAPWLRPALGGVAVATAAVTVLWWMRAPAPRDDGAAATASRSGTAEGGAATEAQPADPAVAGASQMVAAAGPAVEVIDVAVALADEAAAIDRSYRDAVSELVELIGESRASWTAGYARRYDDQVRQLRARVDSEAPGKDRERAWQELMRYLQTSLTRAELAMGGP
jgi:anti-sigma factor RsiW